MKYANNIKLKETNEIIELYLNNNIKKEYIELIPKNITVYNLLVLLKEYNYPEYINNILINTILNNLYKERDIYNSLNYKELDKDTKNIIINNYLSNIINNNYPNIDYAYRYKIMNLINEDIINNKILDNTINNTNIDNINNWDINIFIKIINKYLNEKLLSIHKKKLSNILSYLSNSKDLELLKNYLELNKIINDENISKENYNNFINNLINETYNMRNILEKNNIDKKIVDIVKMIIDEVRDHEKANLKDIEYIGIGTYSFVIGIKSKVIKLGPNRNNYYIKNSPYILQPIIRKKLDDNYIIEVTERVNTNIKTDDDKLYTLYKNLRDNNIHWTDINSDNVGILLKDNIPNYYLRTGPIKTNPKNIGLIGKNNKILKKGEYVIIDLDYIYDSNDKNIIIPHKSKQKIKKFEQKYIKDKEK